MKETQEQLAELEARMLANTVWLRAEFFRRVAALTAEEIAVLAKKPDNETHDLLRGWRAKRQIFAVTRAAQDLYPAFQFDAELKPRLIICEILQILGQVKSRTDWDNALWFVAANDWLDGPSPIELLATDPVLVKDAAEQEVLPSIE